MKSLKKYFKNIILKAVDYSVYFSGIYFLLDKLIVNKGIYILMYHRIGDKNDKNYFQNFSVKKEELIKQIEFFKKKYSCISLTEAISILRRNYKLGKDYIVFTFDDGYTDNLKYGVPIFLEYNIHPTIYLTASKIDRGEPLWTEIVDCILTNCTDLSAVEKIFNVKAPDNFTLKGEIYNYTENIKAILKEMPQDTITRNLEELASRLKTNQDIIKSDLLDWKGIKTLINSGWEIGSHTLNHVNLAIECKETVVKELEESALIIENRTGFKITDFSYPFGKEKHFDEFAVESVKKYYRSAVTSVDGINKLGDDLFTFKRVMIANHYSVIDVKVKLLRIKLKDFLVK